MLITGAAVAADACCTQSVTVLVSLSINIPCGMSGSCVLPLLWSSWLYGNPEVKIPLVSQLLWANLVLLLVYLFSTNFKNFIIACLLITCCLSAWPLLQPCLQPWEAVDLELFFFPPQLSKKLLPEQSDSFRVFIFVLPTARVKLYQRKLGSPPSLMCHLSL